MRSCGHTLDLVILPTTFCRYAHAILGDLAAGSAGWIDWNILLDSTGGPNHLGNLCDAPMVASADYDSVHLHPQYWYLGHFSKFVPPGSKVIRMVRIDDPTRKPLPVLPSLVALTRMCAHV